MPQLLGDGRRSAVGEFGAYDDAGDDNEDRECPTCSRRIGDDEQRPFCEEAGIDAASSTTTIAESSDAVRETLACRHCETVTPHTFDARDGAPKPYDEPLRPVWACCRCGMGRYGPDFRNETSSS